MGQTNERASGTGQTTDGSWLVIQALASARDNLQGLNPGEVAYIEARFIARSGNLNVGFRLRTATAKRPTGSVVTTVTGYVSSGGEDAALAGIDVRLRAGENQDDSEVTDVYWEVKGLAATTIDWTLDSTITIHTP
jgi:hypothetical protein